jgi:hypothetical protein
MKSFKSYIIENEVQDYGHDMAIGPHLVATKRSKRNDYERSSADNKWHIISTHKDPRGDVLVDDIPSKKEARQHLLKLHKELEGRTD